MDIFVYIYIYIYCLYAHGFFIRASSRDRARALSARAISILQPEPRATRATRTPRVMHLHRARSCRRTSRIPKTYSTRFGSCPQAGLAPRRTFTWTRTGPVGGP